MPTILFPAIILLSTLLYGAVHSLLASLPIKAWGQERFGDQFARFYRLSYNVFAILTLLPILALPAFLPDHTLYTIPFPWVLVSIFIQGLAAIALLAGLLQTGVWSFLGLEQLISPPTKEADRLVIHGLYRWVRHPLYTAGLVIVWLTPVMTVNVLALILGLSIYIVMGAYLEERKLIAEFGQPYRAYCQGTPFLIPMPKITKKDAP